jgi:hypothetical protein
LTPVITAAPSEANPISFDISKKKKRILSDNIQSKILSSVEQSPFFSIQIDEGTDFSNLTTLMIYIRYLNESGHIDSKFACK